MSFLHINGMFLFSMISHVELSGLFYLINTNLVGKFKETIKLQNIVNIVPK